MENDLDSFLAAESTVDDQLSVQAPKPAEQRVFDQIADQERGESKASLQQSMFVAKDKSPDKQAKVLDISKKLSLPPSFVDRNFDSLSKKVDTQIDYDGMVDKNPRLTQWLSNSDNAALAKDDLAPLQDIEDTTHEYTGLSKAYHALNGGMASLFSSIAKAPRFVYDVGQTVTNNTLDEMQNNFTGTLSDIGKNIPRLPDAPEDNYGKDVAKFFDDIADYERSKIPDLGVDIFREIKAGNKAKAANALFIQAVNSAPSSMAALVAFATGFGEAGLIGIGITSGAQKYDQNLEKQKQIAADQKAAADSGAPAISMEGGSAPRPGEPGFLELMSPDAPTQKQEQFTKNQALLDASIYGTIEAGVESISFGVFKHWEKALLKQFGKNVTKEVMLAFGKTMAASTLSEGGEEMLTQVGQAYTDYLTGVDKNALKDLAGQTVNAGLVGGASGGLFSGPATITTAIAKHQQATQTNIARQYYDKMAEKVKVPKLKKRSSDSQTELVQEITKDGPETVFVPVAAYEKYLQSKDLSPAEFSETLGVREKYDEAVETGGDVAVPYSVWLDKLVDTEHYAGLKDDVKFDSEMLTFNQQKDEADALTKADEQVQADAKTEQQHVETVKKLDETAPIRQSIEEQLIKTGRASPQEAKDNAAAVEAVFKTLAEREGLNPVELFNKYGVRIEAADTPAAAGALNQSPVEKATTQSLLELEGRYGVNFKNEVQDASEGEVRQLLATKSVEQARELAANQRRGRLESGQSSNAAAMAPSEPLRNAPTNSARPNQSVRQLAENYVRNSGLKVARQSEYARVDPVRSKKIADAFEAMKHEPSNPEVKAAYAALIQETISQFQIVKQMGLKIEAIPAGAPNPYASSQALFDDVASGHMWFFSTDQGFGTENNVENNPLLAPTNEVDSNGKPLLANDVFRIVHDIFGHVKEGNSFGQNGEENAWQSHVRMYSALAAKAMTTETRGQNSWVNFGPHAETNKTDPANTVFADQKVGLLPDWAQSEGLVADEESFNQKKGDNSLVRLEAAGWNFSVSYDPVFDEDGEIVGEVKDKITVFAEKQGGSGVGEGHFRLDGNQWVADDSDGENGIKVTDALQGMGIATAIYQAVERDTKKVIRPSSWQTEDGKGFWNQQNRPFGNEVPYGYEKKGKRLYKIKEPQTFYQDKNNPLAQIAMREGETIIRLFQGKDKSSFLHETGHLYMRVLNDLVSRPEASAELKQDFQEILKYLEVKDIGEVKEFQQEKFAETLEAYVMRGVAPSTALKRVFDRFKNWLTSIYGSIKNTYFQRYGVQITPEIKDVLDRMFATKEEIKKAQDTMNYSVLPAAALGMNPEQQVRYMNAVDEARRNSDEVLLAKLMRDSDVKRQPEYKAKRKEVETNITADVNNSPGFKAIDLIKNTTLEKDGLELKINREEVKKLYADSYKAMPSGTTQVDGMPVEMVAEQLGFKNGKELIEAISKAGNRSEIIEARVEAEMSDLFPDLLESGELAQAALDAIHNDEWTKVMEMEWQHVVENNPAVLKDLIRRGTRINFTDPARRKQAKLMMQQKRVVDIRPIDYQRAGAKAAREAGVLLSQGDFAGFIEAKRQQLLNHELYKAALEVKALTKKGNDLFKQIYRTKTQDAAKTRDIDYLMVQKAILAQFGIGPEQPLQADEYLEKIQNYDPITHAMLKPIMDSALQGAAGWQTLSVARYSQLVDDMRAMRDIGRDARQFQLAQEKIEFDKVKEETMLQNDEHGKNPQKYDHEKTRWDEFKIKVLGWKNSMLRTEAWVRTMDLGARGPWNKYFWEPINDAFTNYILDKNNYYQKFVGLTKEWAKSLSDNDWKPIEASELGRKADGSVTQFKNKLDLIAAIKHTGNLSNLMKLLGGFGWGTIDENGEVDPTNWNKFMNRMYKEGRITQADMEYIQNTWNIYEELKPRAQAAHKKDTGYYFNEIKAQEIVTPFGRYKGGYVPLVYDRSANPSVARNALKSEILESNPGYEMPNVSKGMTKERVKFFSPLSLDLQQTNRDLDNVLKFINMRAPVKQAARLLYNKEFSASIHAVDPTVIENLLEPFLQRASTNRVVFTDGKTKKWLNDFAGFLKASATANTMIWNFGNALQNYASLFPAQVNIDQGSLWNSLKHTRAATVSYLTAPNDTANFIAEKSKFMRTEIEEGAAEAQRDLKGIALNPSRITKAADFLEANSFALMKMTQRQTSNIVWLAAYNSALSRGLEIDGAVRHADATVRTTQGDQRSIGVSEIETGSPWYRNFSMYTGFFNVIGNMINTEANVALKTLTPKQATARLGTIYTMGFMMLAVGGDLIIKGMRGKLDEDDDEEYLDDFIYTFFDSQFRFGTAMIPLVGPTINYSRKYFDKNINQVFGVEDRPTYTDDKLSLSPAVSTLESGVRGIYSGVKLLSDDKEFKTRDLKDGMTLLGLVASGATGRTIPLGGFQKPVGYLKDVVSGDAEPEGPVDFTQGLITGKQSK
jgi:hypothetical protein